MDLDSIAFGELAVKQATDQLEAEFMKNDLLTQKLQMEVMKRFLKRKNMSAYLETYKVNIVKLLLLPTKYVVTEKATILFWDDGTKTIVKKMSDTKNDPILAYLTAFFQKNSGLSKTAANKYLMKVEEEAEKLNKED